MPTTTTHAYHNHTVTLMPLRAMPHTRCQACCSPRLTRMPLFAVSHTLCQACCSPYHRGDAAVPGPEALLRSRYSAYAAKEPQYIADTTHPDSPEYTGSRASYIGTCSTAWY